MTSTAAKPNDAWPLFDDEMVEVATRVLRSGRVNYWTGDEGRQFEAEFATACQCRHGIAVANGTLALELALYALDVGPGDEVIVPSRTFIATASAVVARGARPVCADVDRDSQTLTSATVARLQTPSTKAVIAVHLAGWPCDMKALATLCRQRGLALVEDCAQAHGARFCDLPVGALGDVAAFSFCQDKILTTAGEGGMLVTNRPDVWERAWRYKDHGKSPEAKFSPQPGSADYRWLHESFGSNFRLSEVQSAVGRVMLRRLPEWVAARNRHATELREVCETSQALRTPRPPGDVLHAYYKFYTFVRPEMLAPGWSRNRIIEELRRRDAPCFSGSCSEIYREQAFPPEWRPAKPLPTARELGETSLMFLVHPTLSAATRQRTLTALAEVMELATRPSSVQKPTAA